ncbi:MAG TPA: gas vesicle protein [Pyrinomonadaceae bacterium]|jgi:hypothetical protein|nr:gas vesicle protein [Pyrinomonadaceae bacterium]
MEEELAEFEGSELSLLETLDHVLTRGLVIAGEITIAVADVDLVFMGLNVVLTSVETAHEVLGARDQLKSESPHKALALGAANEDATDAPSASAPEGERA